MKTRESASKEPGFYNEGSRRGRKRRYDDEKPKDAAKKTKCDSIEAREKRIPFEVLCDVFQFMDRNEIEKSQLVCDWWNTVVESEFSFLQWVELFCPLGLKR